MFFSFAIILAIASTAIEMLFAAKIPAWRRAAKNWKIVNLVISILLSFVLSIMFGAAGLIAMTAAIFSTLMSIPGYAFLHWMYDSDQAQQHGGNMLRYYADRWKQVMIDLGTLIYKILKIITAPIWITRAVILWMRRMFVKGSNLKARLVRP